MKHQPERTKNTEWREFVGDVQKNVNETLDALRGEVDIINAVLVDKYIADADDIIDYINGAIQYLDKKWGYDRDYFLVSGHWYEPMIGLSDEGILVKHDKKEAFNIVRSNGFTAVPHDDDSEVPHISMSFICTQFSRHTYGLQGDFQALGYANLREISLQYMRPGDSSVVSSGPDEVFTMIERADALLFLHTNHQQSTFYRQTSKKQAEFLRAINDIVYEALPAPDSLDTVMINNATTQVVYYKDSRCQKVKHLKASDEESHFEISGEVVGVTTTDAIDNIEGKRYQDSAELAAAGIGLSLIIKPYTMNFVLPDNEIGDLLIPFRALDAFELSVE